MIWDSSRQLALESKVDENKAWERFQNRTHPAQDAASQRNRRFPWLRMAAAAVFVIGIGVLGYVLINNRNISKDMEVIARQFPVTDTLPDGSVITLNKHSSALYTQQAAAHTRDVSLKGDAFFNVVPDKNKPFIVRINDVQVTVVGTSFYIKSSGGGTEVVVESGIVRVSKAGRTIELRPGERTTVSGSDSVPVKEETTDKLYNYYRTREFVCDDTPLWKLIEVLNEAYNVNIIIGKKELKDLRLDTTFVNESLDQVLQVISLTFNITVTRSGDQIVLQ